jgi:hypothetical protein
MTYPNPTAGLINIEFNKSGFKDCLLEIYDLNGTEILNKGIKSKIEIVNIGFYKAGCYILQIRQDGLVYRKLILKR